jgi:hypothetical protein
MISTSVLSTSNCKQGGSSLCLLLLLSHPFLHKPLYKIFLRVYQALAVLSAYATWQHLPSKSPFPKVYIYIVARVFLTTLTWQCGLVIFRNRARGRGYCQAFITTLDKDENHSSKEEVVKIRLALSQKLKVKAGQFINLWIPSVSF